MIYRLLVLTLLSLVSVGALSTPVQAAPQKGADTLFPRFVGEMMLIGDKVSYAADGPGATMDGRYQWWDLGIRYDLAAGKKNTDVTGTVDLNLKGVSLQGYDQLVMMVTPHWTDQTISLVGVIDGVEKRVSHKVTARNHSVWITVPTEGGKHLDNIKVVVTTNTRGKYSAIIDRIMLRNAEQYAMQKAHWKRYADVNWDRLLKPQTFTPSFKVTKGLYYNDTEIQEIREFLNANPDVKKSFLVNPTHTINKKGDIGEFVFPVLPYMAKEEHMSRDSYYLHHAGRDAAFAGLVTKDPKMMRAAAKHALVLATYGNWSDLSIPDAVPGRWYGSAFWSSFVTEALALNLDYAGEMLTDDGYKYVLQALYKKGVAEITYSLYSRPMYKMNQYVYFNSGRITATLLMEKNWPEIKHETDYFVKLMQKSMDHLFREDGSFKESTGYLDVVVPHTLKTYYMYAKARGLKLEAVVAPSLYKSVKHAEFLRSTQTRQGYDMLPVGDTHGATVRPQTMGYMAMMTPGSAWEAIYQRNPLKPTDIQNWFIYKSLKDNQKADPAWPTLVDLPKTGLAASHRTLGDKMVKLAVVGNNDRGKAVGEGGSFILEYGGESLALGMPNVRWGQYANCMYYNMLVPKLKDESFPKMVKKSVELKVQGDAKIFSAQFNLANQLAKSQMTQWKRAIDSPSPDTIIITDDYAVTDRAQGVDFLWQSEYPITIDGSFAIIDGKSVRCRISAPGCTLRVESFQRPKGGAKAMGLPSEHTFHRLHIHKAAQSGTIVVTATLSEK